LNLYGKAFALKVAKDIFHGGKITGVEHSFYDKDANKK
jgi:hypothetical protein